LEIALTRSPPPRSFFFFFPSLSKEKKRKRKERKKKEVGYYEIHPVKKSLSDSKSDLKGFFFLIKKRNSFKPDESIWKLRSASIKRSKEREKKN
jgi:hypothetical protein